MELQGLPGGFMGLPGGHKGVFGGLGGVLGKKCHLNHKLKKTLPYYLTFATEKLEKDEQIPFKSTTLLVF